MVTSRSWSAATTEGLLIYSLDQNIVFDPFELEVEITPPSVLRALEKGDYSMALMLSFRLNEQKLIQEVTENILVSDIDICHSVPSVYVDKMLAFVAGQVETSAHVEFYMTWIERLLTSHGTKLKQRSQSVMATLRTLQKNVTHKYEDLGKLCDHNRYAMEYTLSLSNLKRKSPALNSECEIGNENPMDDENEDIVMSETDSDSVQMDSDDT